MSDDAPKYDWSHIEGVRVDEDAAEAAGLAARESERQADFARWRALRWAVAVALVCLSIAGGAVAVLAILVALGSTGDTVSVVTTIEAEGAVERTFTRAQLYLAVAGLVAMEAVLIWAALLLFARKLHPAQWVAVLLLAASTTAVFAWAMLAGGLDVPAVNLPYVIAYPCICVAALLELARVRRLRAAWGEDV